MLSGCSHAYPSQHSRLFLAPTDQQLLPEEDVDEENVPALLEGLSILKRKIVSFHQDEQHHWVADLECGHQQHVRHDPPLIKRPWVLTLEGRKSRIGAELDCKNCDESKPVGTFC